MSNSGAFKDSDPAHAGDASTSRSGRRWRIVVAVLLLLTAGWFVLDGLAAMKLRRAQRAADALGLPRTFAEALSRRPPVADADNMAPGLLEAGRAINAYRKPVPEQERPEHLAILDRLDRQPRGSRWTPKRLTAARRFLKDNEKPVALAMEVTRRPAGRYANNVAELTSRVNSPHLFAHRDVIWALDIAVQLAAQDGDLEAALAGLHAMLRADCALTGEPTFLAGMVASAARAQTVTSIAQLLTRTASLSDEQLEALHRAIVDWRPELPLVDGMAGEHALLRESIEQVYAGASVGGAPVTAPGLQTLAILMRLAPGLASLDQAELLSFTTRICMAFGLPPHEAIQQVKGMNKGVDELPRYCHFSRRMMPKLQASAMLSFRELGQRRSVVALLAIERYRLRHGDLPAGLEELAPEFLEAVPMDPFDGHPIRYRQVLDGAVVYSIGYDESDDGGAIGDPEQRKSKATDWGYMLLNPELRGRPAVEDAAPPTDGTASTAPSPGIHK